MPQSITTNALRITLILLLLCGLAAALLVYYISRFDLEDYRRTVERHLSATLQQPVSIGSSTVTYHQGLALEFRDIRIGSDQHLRIDIPQLTATLLLPPLLRRELVFEEVNIQQLQMHIRLPLPDSPRQHPVESGEFWSGLAIRMFRLNNAEFNLYAETSDDNRPLLQLTNVHAVLQNRQPDTRAQLIMAGQVQADSDFLFETSLPPDFSFNNWRSADLQAQLQVMRLLPATLFGHQHVRLQEPVQLEITLAGRPDQGATVNAHINQSKTSSSILTARGHWQSSTTEENFTTQSATFLGLPVTTEFKFQYQPRKLTAQLSSGNQLLNPDNFSNLNITVPTSLQSANLEQLFLRFAQTWTNETDRPVAQLTGRLTLSDLQWEDKPLWAITSLTTGFALTGADIVLAESQITTGLGDLVITGRIRQMLSKPDLDLRITAQPELEQLHQHLSLSEDWQLSGVIPVDLHLQGDPNHPLFQLRADATRTGVRIGRFYTKPESQTAWLSAAGRFSNAALQLSSFNINLFPFLLTGAAEVHRTKEGVFATLTTQPVELTTLGTLSPALHRLQLKGQASLEASWLIDHWQGELYVQEGGAHLTSVIGALNSVTGTARLDHDGLFFDQLPANLGASSFIVNGVMRNWREPQLRLIVEASAARAQDLVFLNPDLMLYDLQGQLDIDRHGIRFDPVTVTVEESTRATVFGSVTNFSDPEVELDILGERADILDIIDLFRHPMPRDRTTKFPDREHKPIVIRAQVMAGTLGRLNFSNARATITDHKGILSIYPLTFENGDGWSRAKVEYVYRHPTAPLKISGHINDIDAFALHHDLLQRPGLIRGKLTGDFYLEGDPGAGDFWQTATGGAYFQVRNGTLRKFHGLAKVFSLLNVSQIFTGNLPDMDREGLPFNLMEGSIRITAGLLHTDDLKITGEAMNLSLVGKRDLTNDTSDMILAVMPLGTVDKVISSIPIAGWVLGGEDRALLTAYFKIEGPNDNPSVAAIPVGTISTTVLGIFRRTLGLPGKLFRDFGALLAPDEIKKAESPEP